MGFNSGFKGLIYRDFFFYRSNQSHWTAYILYTREFSFSISISNSVINILCPVSINFVSWYQTRTSYLQMRRQFPQLRC